MKILIVLVIEIIFCDWSPWLLWKGFRFITFWEHNTSTESLAHLPIELHGFFFSSARYSMYQNFSGLNF